MIDTDITDMVELAFTNLLRALQTTAVPAGRVPGELITWAEVQSRIVRGVLEQLEEYRKWRAKV